VNNGSCWVHATRVTLATMELYIDVFSVWSVPRCYKQDESVSRKCGCPTETRQQLSDNVWTEVISGHKSQSGLDTLTY
jgi:hypothetical protein